MRIAAKSWLLTLIVAGTASAQYQRPEMPYRRPAVSPYINLLRTNEDRRFLYEGIIRPQIEANRFNEQMQQRIGEMNRQTLEREQQTKAQLSKQQQQIGQIAGVLRRSEETGHPTAFRQRSKFFPHLK
jgi:hypothetical protein